MTITATSFISKPLETFRHMIAQSATFRTIVGAEDSDAAKTSIIYFWAEGEPEEARCIVRHANQTQSTKMAKGGFATSAMLVAGFEFPIPAEYQEDHQKAGMDFLNKVGTIVTEIQSFMTTDTGGNSFDGQFILDTETMGELEKRKNNGLMYWAGEILCSYRGG